MPVGGELEYNGERWRVTHNMIHIGPSDYVEWLDDRKWAYVRLD